LPTSASAGRPTDLAQTPRQPQIAQAPWWEAELWKMAEVARQSGWRLVDAVAGSTMDSAVDQASATAVVVVGDPPNLRAVQRAARGAAAAAVASQQAGHPPKPVVAVLVGSAATTPGFHGAAMRAQRELLQHGVDDVIAWAGGSGEADFRLAVSMAITRAELKHRASDEYEQNIHAALAEEPRFGMFWQSVEKIFSGMPPLNKELPSDPEVGMQVGDCSLVKVLGHGSFGEVYLAERAQGEFEAVKAIDKANLASISVAGLLWRELKVLGSIQHPNVVAYHGVMHGPTHIFIRMELGGSQTLYSVVKKAKGGLHTGYVRRFETQLASAVAHLHERGVAHRDLKPENIAVNPKPALIKVLDFGSAAPVDRECADMAGTMPFMAPEILAGGDEAPYNPSGCDVWAAAGILLEMAGGIGMVNRIFNWSNNLEPNPRRFAELQHFFSEPDAVAAALRRCGAQGAGEDFFELVQGMLQMDLACRWTAEQVLNSAWIRAPAAQL